MKDKHNCLEEESSKAQMILNNSNNSKV